MTKITVSCYWKWQISASKEYVFYFLITVYNNILYGSIYNNKGLKKKIFLKNLTISFIYFNSDI